MNKFSILFGIKRAVSPCFRQLPSNLNLNLHLFHSSFGERPLFAIWGDLNFSYENPLNFHSDIVNARPVNNLVVL